MRRMIHLLAMMRKVVIEAEPMLACLNSFSLLVIENMLNLHRKGVGQEKRVRKKYSKKERTKGNSKPKRYTFFTDRPEKYYIASALSNAHSGLAFGQLLQGGASNALEKLRHILGK